jgi:uncharacterized protein
MIQFDWFYLALLAALPVVDRFVFTPMFRRDVVDNPAKARRRLYLIFILGLWFPTGLGIVLWVSEGRAWNAIGLAVPDSWRAWGGAAIVAIVTLIQTWRASKIAGSAEKRQKVRNQLRQLGTLAPMIPRTPSEFRLYVACGLTAGICEEFLLRGYLIWAFHNWLDWWTAAGASLIVFSLGHVYQGLKGVLAAALAGALLTAVLAVCGSLLPAMAIHAAIDIITGYVDWLAMREDADEPTVMRLGEPSNA